MLAISHFFKIFKNEKIYIKFFKIFPTKHYGKLEKWSFFMFFVENISEKFWRFALNMLIKFANKFLIEKSQIGVPLREAVNTIFGPRTFFEKFLPVSPLIQRKSRWINFLKILPRMSTPAGRGGWHGQNWSQNFTKDL